jgi:hypothetical protein
MRVESPTQLQAQMRGKKKMQIMMQILDTDNSLHN